MSMAENRRNPPDYSDDALAPKPREAGDPLAELARLIGQSDPFTDTRAARKPLDGFRADDRPAPEWLARPASAPDESEYDDPRARYDRPAAHPDHDDDPRQAGRFEDRDERDPAHAPYPQHEQGDDQEAQEYRHDDRYRVAPPPPGDYEDYYADDGHMPPHGDEGYAPGRRRGGLMTIAAVLGLAVIGTAGAFGYRAYMSGPSAPPNPPVIKADTTPAKIVPPAPPAADAQAKPFQERVGTTTTERIVPREEQPVSLPVPPPVSRTPPPLAPPQTAFAPAAAPAAAPPPATAPAALDAPKRVRTQTIRPDSEAAAAQPPLNSAPRPPAAKQSGPTPIAPPAEAPRTKVAARPPAPSAGSYVVQVSAQRTETEAQSSYRALQQKYPSVLGGREANIRRVDLGAQGGIFYRAQVGSFATSEQATAFCNNLKDAGGQCIVQRN